MKYQSGVGTGQRVLGTGTQMRLSFSTNYPNWTVTDEVSLLLLHRLKLRRISKRATINWKLKMNHIFHVSGASAISNAGQPKLENLFRRRNGRHFCACGIYHVKSEIENSFQTLLFFGWSLFTFLHILLFPIIGADQDISQALDTRPSGPISLLSSFLRSNMTVSSLFELTFFVTQTLNQNHNILIDGWCYRSPIRTIMANTQWSVLKYSIL